MALVEGYDSTKNKVLPVQITDTYAMKVSLEAGTVIAGKVGIDQTTDGTTNLVRTKEAVETAYSALTAASGVIKASPGVLKFLQITNNKASAQYFQLHNTAAVPADAAVPFLTVYLQAGGTYFVEDLTFPAGIVWCNSSTRATKTIGSADCDVVAMYL